MALQPPDQSKGGPPAVPPGATVQSIPQGMLDRLKNAVGSFMRRGPAAFKQDADGTPLPAPTDRPAMAPQAAEPSPADIGGFMNPGRPQPTIATNYRDVAGRAFDYQPGINTTGRVRQYEPISIETLRNIAENYDLLRLAVETRKDQLSKLGWSIMLRKEPGAQFRPKPNDACRTIEKCLRRPDGIHTWDQWIRMVAEDSLVVDGVAIYRRRHADGRPYALELVAPETIQPLIDITGRSPLPPQPAYAQIIKGASVMKYTREELTYWRRNPRSHRIYGYSQVEQVVRTAMLGLGRLAKQVGHYTDGQLPPMLLSTPAEWTAEQIAEFQGIFDMLLQNPANRARARFVPPGVGQPIILNTEQVLFGPFDEWLARMICYAFSLPPFPFVQQTNKATAESQYQSAREEGLGPFLTAFKAMIDIEIAEFFGQSECELVWDDVRQLDPTEQAAKDDRDIQRGLASLDDVRAARGQDAVGVPAMIFGLGPMGFLTVDQLKRIIEADQNMPPAPMPMDGMTGEDPLAGAPPELLAQLGIQPPSAGGAAEDGVGAAGGGAPAPSSPQMLAALARMPRDSAASQAINQIAGRYR